MLLLVQQIRRIVLLLPAIKEQAMPIPPQMSTLDPVTALGFARVPHTVQVVLQCGNVNQEFWGFPAVAREKCSLGSFLIRPLS